jgi:hypothetical protein
MKAYGLKNKIRLNLPDVHPQKGWINWWEAEWNKIKSKKTARQKAKTEINNQLKPE